MSARRLFSFAAAAGVAGLLSWGGVAQANSTTTFKIASDSQHWTVPSGVSADNSKKAKSSSKKYGLRKLKFRERSDESVEIRTVEARLSTKFDETTQYAGTAQIRDGKRSSEKVVDVGDGFYIYKVQVCDNGKSDSMKRKIKGLRVWGRRFKSDGSYQQTSSAEQATRPNCKKWRKAVSCGQGEVATGIRAYYDSKNYGFNGIALRCGKVE